MCTGKQFLHVHGVWAEKEGLGCTWSNWAFECSHLTVKFGGMKLSSPISISHLRYINRTGADESRIERRHFIFSYIMIVCMIVRQVFELPPCMLTHGRSTILFAVLPLSSNRLLFAVLMQRMKAALFATWHTAWTFHHVCLIAVTSMSQRSFVMIRVSKLRWDQIRVFFFFFWGYTLYNQIE